MKKEKEAGNSQASHFHSLSVSEDCLGWEQSRNISAQNVPEEGASGFVMKLSNHWMALLYTNVPVSTCS